MKTKVDPALVAKARELRDRWMEQLNACPPMLGEGKYDVARALPAVSTDSAPADRRALEAA